MILLESLAVRQTVTGEAVHRHEREDCAKMTWCNVQLNWLDLGSSGIQVLLNNQKYFIELELGCSAAGAAINLAC